MGVGVSNSPILDKGTYQHLDGTYIQIDRDRNGEFEPIRSPKTTEICTLVEW